ncbi:hypothetical protein [Lysobacter brunescens]|uniref:Uncharacterized protein n=1 Tax=Lysobacter brunescens TaxID=262323 RepID=A0ABW2YG99_9GAMM
MIDLTPTRSSWSSGVATPGWHAAWFAFVAMLALPLPCRAQHPGDIAAWPETTDTPCASVDAPRRADCEAREAERDAERSRTSRDYHAWLADRLAEDGSARDLAIAAHLRAMSISGTLYETGDSLPSLDKDTRLAAWVQRATREGPDDPLVHMLLNRRFSTSDTMRLAALHAQWARIEPGNVVPLMFAAETERPRASALPIRSPTASRFDLHYNALLLAVIDAFERHPPGANRAAVLFGGDVPTLYSYASSMAMAMLQLPRFIDTIDACRGDALVSAPERRTDCQQLGHLLADDSDTLIAHMMGLALLVRASDTPCERAAAEERRRQAGWLMHEWRVLSDDQAIQADETASRQALSSTQDEMSYMRVILQHHGIATEPAPDWKHVPLP